MILNIVFSFIEISLWESEEVYEFIICTFYSLLDDYEAGFFECGFNG